MVTGMPNIPDEYLPKFKLVYNKAIIPSVEEINLNKRSRSSKLRIIERIKQLTVSLELISKNRRV